MGCAASAPQTDEAPLTKDKSLSKRDPNCSRATSYSAKGDLDGPSHLASDSTELCSEKQRQCTPAGSGGSSRGRNGTGSELGGIPEADHPREGSSEGTSSPDTDVEGKAAPPSTGLPSSKGSHCSNGSRGSHCSSGSKGSHCSNCSKGSKGSHCSNDSNCSKGGTIGSRREAGSSSRGSQSIGKYSIESTEDLRVFTFEEMRRATDNFAVKLGEGGFGMVYRGRVEVEAAAGPVDVAVKVLKLDGGQGLREWQAEVVFLGAMQHKNLVRLHGLCFDGQERMLVYEYVSNKSFDCHLFSRPGMAALGFRERMKVVLGAAQGLAYLHKGERGPVIFRDFKTSNILVDKDFNAKLSDFGLAREGPDGSRSHVSTDVVGTSGYLAPEYVTRGHVSERCDVFSFGVVLLEVITGRSAESEPELVDESMVQWAARVAGQSRDGWQQLVDPRLEGRFSGHSVKTTLKAAFMCIQHDPRARPTMENVIETLKVAYTRSMEK